MLNGPAALLVDASGNVINQSNPLPVTLGNSVTGSVTVTNFPTVQQVTGSVVVINETTGVQKVAGNNLSGSVADPTNGPLLVAGVDANGIVRTMLVDAGGRQVIEYQSSSSSAVTSIVSAITNVTLLATNNWRLGGTVYNDSTAAMYLKLGITATNANFTVKIMPQGYYELPTGYVGRVDAIWAAANGNARITELT